jgi:hypothetical protein
MTASCCTQRASGAPRALVMLRHKHVEMPSAPAQLRAEERAINMDVLEMMRKVKDLPETVVGSLI